MKTSCTCSSKFK